MTPSQAVMHHLMMRFSGFREEPAIKIHEHGDGYEQRDTRLFHEEDTVPWIVFTMVFTVLIIFDNFVLHQDNKKLSLLQAMLYTTFWIAVAGMFCVYVYMTRGASDAFDWGTGYLLEWMLSVDNLFVFHRIFESFQTPDDQKHKPLFYGIIGAIVFRMIFFLIEEILLHHVTWMHIVFGLFLIYTGIKAMSMDDDDDDASHGWLFELLVRHIKYIDEYDKDGKFFTLVEVNAATGRRPESARGLSARNDPKCDEVKLVKQWRATRLFLVVVCLEITDLIFAVDSVSAIVAQIPDLFLAYTACVFAMLGLRALFFAIDELVKMFSMLSYGVAAILIFLGFKLILRSWIHIPPQIVCGILLSTLFFSIFASIVKDKLERHEENRLSENGSPEDTALISARAA